jgi:hypothetical protein
MTVSFHPADRQRAEIGVVFNEKEVHGSRAIRGSARRSYVASQNEAAIGEELYCDKSAQATHAM